MENLDKLDEAMQSSFDDENATKILTTDFSQKILF